MTTLNSAGIATQNALQESSIFGQITYMAAMNESNSATRGDVFDAFNTDQYLITDQAVDYYNTTTHAAGSPWNGSSMIGLRNYLIRAYVPANDDCVWMRFHTNDWIELKYYELDSSVVYPVMAIGYNHRNSMSPVGGKAFMTEYHQWITMPVVKKPYARYIYVTDRHEPYTSGHGTTWLSGYATGKNPYGYVHQQAVAYAGHVTDVGYSGPSWYGGWNGDNLMYLGEDTTGYFHVPVAPGAGGRVFFALCHDTPGNSPTARFRFNQGSQEFKMTHLANGVQRSFDVCVSGAWRYVGVVIPESIISGAGLITNGGWLRVDFHHYGPGGLTSHFYTTGYGTHFISYGQNG